MHLPSICYVGVSHKKLNYMENNIGGAKALIISYQALFGAEHLCVFPHISIQHVRSTHCGENSIWRKNRLCFAVRKKVDFFWMMTSQFTHIALQIGRHKRSNHSSLSRLLYKGGELKTLKNPTLCAMQRLWFLREITVTYCHHTEDCGSETLKRYEDAENEDFFLFSSKFLWMGDGMMFVQW